VKVVGAPRERSSSEPSIRSASSRAIASPGFAPVEAVE